MGVLQQNLKLREISLNQFQPDFPDPGFNAEIKSPFGFPVCPIECFPPDSKCEQRGGTRLLPGP